MTYAELRKIIDADSHVIELDDFLINAASEADRDLIPLMSAQKELPVVQAGLDRGRELFEKRQNSTETDLKHTYGRRLRAAGVNFEDRQDLLGSPVALAASARRLACITPLLSRKAGTYEWNR